MMAKNLCFVYVLLFSWNYHLLGYLATLLPTVSPLSQNPDDDKTFIDSEVQKLLKEAVIEPSQSPWRAQPLVTTNSSGKKRLVVDFSQTINKFTELDADQVPNIEELVINVAKNKRFSVIDLSSAYY